MKQKTLVMIRHAKSDWVDTSLPDHDRPLNKRGERDAPMMAELLSELIKRPDILIASTATRAQQTANAFIHKLDPRTYTSEQRLYEASVENILSVIKNIPTDAHIAVLVGHNPGFTSTVEHLTTTPLLNMPTCSIAVMKLIVDEWSDVGTGTATLSAFEVPRDHHK